jgi:hypothetical protein
MATKLRDPQQYQALTVLTVVPDIPKREVAIAFRGDEKEETYDLAVIIPAGIVAALTLQLHEACARIDGQTQDKAVLMQPINLLGAQAADAISGKCAVVLNVGAFQLPAMMSKEAALRTIDALEQSIEALENPRPSPGLN